MNRREFVRMCAATAIASGAGRALSFAAGPTTGPTTGPTAAQAAKPIRVGFITDLHHALFGKDQAFRLKAFIDHALATPTDFILQGGDFCYPTGCPAILAEWNRYPGDKFHVLGNHDMDKCDKATIMKLWGMPAPYYSFDRGGFHFVVLDRNNFRKDNAIVAYNKGNWGYRKTPADLNCCDEAQLTWLADDLKKTDKPTVVWAHQPLIATDNPGDIGNGNEILDLFDAANFAAVQATGRPKVVAAFFGHDHNDLYGERNGVHYVLLNSASYAYTSAGASFYQDSLFAFVTFDPAGKITIEGTRSTYGPKGAPDKVRMRIPPRISDRSLATPMA
jgi:hypothetical protein